jgi:hypothetical protein
MFYFRNPIKEILDIQVSIKIRDICLQSIIIIIPVSPRLSRCVCAIPSIIFLFRLIIISELSTMLSRRSFWNTSVNKGLPSKSSSAFPTNSPFVDVESSSTSSSRISVICCLCSIKLKHPETASKRANLG